MGADSGGGSDRPGSTTFNAVVSYLRPDYKELMRRFPGNVDHLFRNADFVEIKRRKGISRGETRSIEFKYVHMGSKYEDLMFGEKVVLGEMDHLRLRPALYEELLGFAEMFPDEQYKFPIIALGSVMTLNISKVAPYLWCNTRDRTLEMHWFGGGCRHYSRFLAVRRAR